jgi:hypothetical protein
MLKITIIFKKKKKKKKMGFFNPNKNYGVTIWVISPDSKLRLLLLLLWVFHLLYHKLLCAFIIKNQIKIIKNKISKISFSRVLCGVNRLTLLYAKNSDRCI